MLVPLPDPTEDARTLILTASPTEIVAPLAPLTAEEVWRGLTGGRSVHLTDFPEPADLPADDGLVAAVEGNTVRLSANADVAVTFEEEA